MRISSNIFRIPPRGVRFDAWFDKAATKTGAAGVFLVVMNSTQKIGGSSRFYEVALEIGRLSVGHTFYEKSVRGSAVNLDAKLLLLTEAFEKLNLERIQICANRGAL
jgi:RimJ/RimL family protein N-acetyltransferase